MQVTALLDYGIWQCARHAFKSDNTPLTSKNGLWRRIPVQNPMYLYAHEGALRRRHHTQQAEQMWCLTLATNAIVCWMAEYHGLAVTTLRQAGRRIDDEVLAHIWPSHHENVHFYGTHTVDIAAELATLDTNGYRPLRVSPAHRG